MIERLAVYFLVGGIGGTASIYLEVPGALLALVLLLVLGATVRTRAQLVRPGAYLLGVGVTGFAIVGPASHLSNGGDYFYASPAALAAYGSLALVGALVLALLALSELHRRNRAR